MRFCARILLVAITLIGIVHSATYAHEEGVPLSSLESQIDGSLAVQAAIAESLAAEASASATRDKLGYSAFARNTLGRHRDIVLNGVVRSYFVEEPTLGLTFPIFGTRETQDQNIVVAESAQRLADLDVDAGKRTAIQQLRSAYIDYYDAWSKQSADSGFADEISDSGKLVRALTKSGFATEADTLRFADLRSQIQNETLRTAADERAALAQMGAVLGKNMSPFNPIFPEFAGCVPAESVAYQDALDHDVTLQKLVVQSEEMQRLGDLQHFTGLDASLDIGIAPTFELPGGAGYSALVTGTISVPQHLKALREDTRKRLVYTLQQYSLLSAQRSEDIRSLLTTALASQRDAGSQLRVDRVHEAALDEDLRETKIRLRFVDPRSLHNVLTGEILSYEAGVNVIESESRNLRAILGVLDVSPDACTKVNYFKH